MKKLIKILIALLLVSIFTGCTAKSLRDTGLRGLSTGKPFGIIVGGTALGLSALTKSISGDDKE